MIRTSSRGTISASGARRTSSSATRRKAAAAPACPATGVAAAVKEAVAGTGTQEPFLRPASRGAMTRRRPAPKAITECALKAGSGAVRPQSAGSVQGAWEVPPAVVPLGAAARGGPAEEEPAARATPTGRRPAPAGDLASHCSITMEADASSEIRTKVFRMGAPLLRSTIPLSLGEHSHRASLGHAADVAKDHGFEEGDEETVLSVSDGEDELAGLSVTLDFPC